jgi:translocation and assembly module TamA
VIVSRKFKLHWNLQWGYDRSYVVSTLESTPVSEAGLNASLFTDTRDNVLDPRRGRFLSVSLNYEPHWLGSDFTFVKGLGQAFFIRSLNPSFVWAQGARLGLATGLGGQILNTSTLEGETQDTSSNNFHAGGADSLRGYGTNEVGPKDDLGNFLGGDAVLILNEELRYRHSSGVGAAVFYDVGNVFATIGSATFTLRHDLGFGLRYASPVGLLRLDFGFPLNRLPGDKAIRIFLHLGQIF